MKNNFVIVIFLLLFILFIACNEDKQESVNTDINISQQNAAIADSLFFQFDFSGADSFYNLALKQFPKLNSYQDSSEYANIAYLNGRTSANLHRDHIADSLYLLAEVIYRQLEKSDIPLTTILYSRGNLRIRSKPIEAESFYRQALEVLELNPEENLSQILQLYKVLESSLFNQKKYREAIKIAELRSAAYTNLLGFTDSLNLEVVENISTYYKFLGKYEESKAWTQGVIEIIQDDPNVSTLFIAEFYKSLVLDRFKFGETDSIEFFIKKSLSAADEYYPSDHYKLPMYILVYVKYLKSVGKHEKAEPWIERTIKICDNPGSTEYSLVHNYLNMYADDLREFGKIEAAERIKKKAEEMKTNFQNKMTTKY